MKFNKRVIICLSFTILLFSTFAKDILIEESLEKTQLLVLINDLNKCILDNTNIKDPTILIGGIFYNVYLEIDSSITGNINKKFYFFKYYELYKIFFNYLNNIVLNIQINKKISLNDETIFIYYSIIPIEKTSIIQILLDPQDIPLYISSLKDSLIKNNFEAKLSDCANKAIKVTFDSKSENYKNFLLDMFRKFNQIRKITSKKDISLEKTKFTLDLSDPFLVFFINFTPFEVFKNYETYEIVEISKIFQNKLLDLDNMPYLPSDKEVWIRSFFGEWIYLLKNMSILDEKTQTNIDSEEKVFNEKIKELNKKINVYKNEELFSYIQQKLNLNFKLEFTSTSTKKINFIELRNIINLDLYSIFEKYYETVVNKQSIINYENRIIIMPSSFYYSLNLNENLEFLKALDENNYLILVLEDVDSQLKEIVKNKVLNKKVPPKILVLNEEKQGIIEIENNYIIYFSSKKEMLNKNLVTTINTLFDFLENRKKENNEKIKLNNPLTFKVFVDPERVHPSVKRYFEKVIIYANKFYIPLPNYKSLSSLSSIPENIFYESFSPFTFLVYYSPANIKETIINLKNINLNTLSFNIYTYNPYSCKIVSQTPIVVNINNICQNTETKDFMNSKNFELIQRLKTECNIDICNFPNEYKNDILKYIYDLSLCKKVDPLLILSIINAESKGINNKINLQNNNYIYGAGITNLDFANAVKEKIVYLHNKNNQQNLILYDLREIIPLSIAHLVFSMAELINNLDSTLTIPLLSFKTIYEKSINSLDVATYTHILSSLNYILTNNLKFLDDNQKKLVIYYPTTIQSTYLWLYHVGIETKEYNNFKYSLEQLVNKNLYNYNTNQEVEKIIRNFLNINTNDLNKLCSDLQARNYIQGIQLVNKEYNLERANNCDYLKKYLDPYWVYELIDKKTYCHVKLLYLKQELQNPSVLLFPVAFGKITSFFGYRKVQEGRKCHKALDIVGELSDTSAKRVPILASMGGKVVLKNYDKFGYGNYVVIKSKFKEKTVFHLYAHMKKSLVDLNQEVSKGEIIGIMGDTGIGESHLHYELLYDNNNNNIFGFHEDFAINPLFGNLYGDFAKLGDCNSKNCDCTESEWMLKYNSKISEFDNLIYNYYGFSNKVKELTDFYLTCKNQERATGKNCRVVYIIDNNGKVSISKED